MHYSWSSIHTVDNFFFRSVLHLSWLKHRVQAPSIAGTDLESKLKFVTSPFVPDLYKVPQYGKPC